MHRLDTVEGIADRCVVLEAGRLAAEGAPSEVLGDTALLERAHLVYRHKHRHPHGVVHSHPRFAHAHRHPASDGNSA